MQDHADSEYWSDSSIEYLSSVDAEEIEGGTEKSRIRRVDAFCHAGDAKDMTVQLSLELRDDLTDEFEQFRLLVQLGRFHAAKKHFKKHLESHAHHLCVRVEYADMLWRQKDFNSLTQLVTQPLADPEEDDMHLQVGVNLHVGLHRDEDTDAEKYQALHQYWSVLRAYTLALHDIAQLTETDRKGLRESVKALEKVLRQPDKAISSNEVGNDDSAI